MRERNYFSLQFLCAECRILNKNHGFLNTEKLEKCPDDYGNASGLLFLIKNSGAGAFLLLTDVTHRRLTRAIKVRRQLFDSH